MVLKFKVDTDKKKWLQLDRQQDPVAAAAVAALRDVASSAVKLGQANIARAGAGFTHAQWVSGLNYRTQDATKGGQPSLDAKAIVYHRYGIAGVFEYGATIEGKPLLWIPTTDGAPNQAPDGRSRRLPHRDRTTRRIHARVRARAGFNRRDRSVGG